MTTRTFLTVGIEQLVRSGACRRRPLPTIPDARVELVRRYGLLAPVPVRPAGTRRWEIVAREEDWLAVQHAGHHEIPVVVLDDLDADDIERIAAVDDAADPIAEARRLRDRLDVLRRRRGHGSLKALSTAVGRPSSWINHRLRLLELPDEVRRAIAVGLLSPGHGRALGRVDDAHACVSLALEAAEGRWPVRRLEASVRDHLEGRSSSGTDAPRDRSPDIERLERHVGGIVGSPVTIDQIAGTLTLDYRGSPEVLDGLLERLGASVPEDDW